jgi:hypothetical protein
MTRTSMVKRRGPSEPCKSLCAESLAADDQEGRRRTHRNPLTGMRDVPVANWSSRLFFSAGHSRTIFQNQVMISSFCW